jgi:hypothetical protein
VKIEMGKEILIKKDGKLVPPSDVILKMAEVINAAKRGEHGDYYETFLEGWEVIEVKDE